MVVNKLVDYILRFLIVCVTLLSRVCNKANHTEIQKLYVIYPFLVDKLKLAWVEGANLCKAQLSSVALTKHQFSLQPVWLEDGSFMFTIVSFSSFFVGYLSLVYIPLHVFF